MIGHRRMAVIVAVGAALVLAGGSTVYAATTASQPVSCTIDANVLACPLPAPPPPATVTTTSTATTTATAVATTTVTAPPTTATVTRTASVTNTVTPTTSASTTTTTAAPVAGANLNLDWNTCNTSQWTGNSSLEAGSTPAHQSVVVSDLRRTATGCANRFEIHNASTDINSGFRALWSKYDTQEGTAGGSDFVYGLSIRVSAVPNYAAVWELHQRANIYSVDNDLALAPHALMFRSGQLQYREMTGAAQWVNGQWTSYANYQDQKVLLPTVAADTWYDVMIRIKTSEGTDGLTQVYARQAGQPWPSTPNWQNAGPSVQYIPGGLDPNIPNKISTFTPAGGYSGLFVTTGIYTGSNTWAQSVSQVNVWIDELRRYPDLPSAKAGWNN